MFDFVSQKTFVNCASSSSDNTTELIYSLKKLVQITQQLIRQTALKSLALGNQLKKTRWRRMTASECIPHISHIILQH